MDPHSNTTAAQLPTLALGNSIAKLLQLPVQLAAAVVDGTHQRLTGGCAIPAPCWEPKHAGDCAMQLRPGQKALISVHVTNCGWIRQMVTVTGMGKLAGWLSFAPTVLVLDAQERATFAVQLKVPEDMSVGKRLSGPLLLRGCRDHFVRLDVTVSDCGGMAVCDVAINDCADNVHHWYDHFYCPRPCNVQRVPDYVQQPGPAGVIEKAAPNVVTAASPRGVR
ncbi:MAG: hypothetical protein ABI311_13810 [Gemmatimonadaceae bacterium]